MKLVAKTEGWRGESDTLSTPRHAVNSMGDNDMSISFIKCAGVPPQT